MFRRKNKNICGYWDCNNRIPNDDFLCTEHHEKWVVGLIDRCPKCSRFKDVMYYMCLDCYFGRQVKLKKELPPVTPKPNQYYKVQYSQAWTDGYMMPDKCFIYVLEFDDGTLHVGRTVDIYSQLSELREEKTSPTAGYKAKLQYLEIAVNEEAAKLREAELKRLVQSKPDQIRAMAIEFHHHMRELGLEEDL